MAEYEVGPLGVQYATNGGRNKGFVILMQPVFRVVETGELRKERGYDTELAYDVWTRLPRHVAEAEGIAVKREAKPAAKPAPKAKGK